MGQEGLGHDPRGELLELLTVARARESGVADVVVEIEVTVVGPDGVVDSTIVSDHKDFGTTMEEKKRDLLKSDSSS